MSDHPVGTTPSPGPAPRSPSLPVAFAAVVAYAVRITVGSRRWLVLYGGLVVAALGVGLLAHVPGEPTDRAFAEVALVILFGLVIPLACLVVGDGALGAEIRSGTFQLTWLSPVPVWVIVIGRWLAAWALGAAGLVGASVVAALVAGSAVNAAPLAVASVLAAAAYVAVFVLVGAVFRLAALWSLVLIFLVEQLLGAVLSGIAQYAPGWLGRGVFADLGTGTGSYDYSGVPTGTEAIVRLVVVTAVVLALATWRLRSLSLSGGRD